MKVIVDVDPGDDDAQALMFILNNPSIEIVAITCVRGNVELDKVCVNILRILKVCGRLDIPVFRGADQFLLGSTKTADGFHGKDGLGDVDWPDDVDLSLFQKEHAVNALIRLAKEHSGDSSLITLGPLTNIALAIRLDSSFGQRFKAVYMMGGNFEGKGNTEKAAEFNFIVDPEAANIVLMNFTCKIYMVPLETCEISFTMAMIAFIHKDVVVESVEAAASIELCGTLTRGMVVVDWDNRWSNQNNVVIYTRLDMEKVKSHMMNMFQ